MNSYDVAILGGGPGGTVAARQATRCGAKTCLIESGRLGGVCLNVGCIPTKALLHGAELYHDMRNCSAFGLSCGEAKVDGEAFLKRSRDLVDTIVSGAEKKFESSEVDLFRGRGRLTGPNTLQVDLNEGGRQQIEARSIIIATGSSPIRPAMFPWDCPQVMTTDEAIRAQTLPESILIVGAGVIGCEFATIYSELGIPTTVVEMLDRVCAVLDEDASKLVSRSLRRRKVDVRLRTKVVKMDCGPDGIVAELDSGKTVEAQCALVAIGRRANIEEIGLEAAGVQTQDGVIAVDDHCRTNVPNIYAAGDVAEAQQYAHLAARMGVIAARNAVGQEASDDRTVVPVAQFTHPEVASVGLSEADARRQNENARGASVQYQATGVGWAYGQRDGLVKIVADSQTGRILGSLVVGYRAAEVLQELALAMRYDLTVHQLAETIHTHPTFVEAVRFAAEQWISENETRTS